MDSKELIFISLLCVGLLSAASLESTTQSTELREELPNAPKIDDDYMRLQVMSSMDRIYVILNGEKKVDLETPDDNETNGLHFIAFNPISGKMVLKRIFTTTLFAEGIGIPSQLKSLRSGEIVVFAVKYDGALNLSRDIRRLFSTIGMTQPNKLNYRCYFVWIFVSGGKTLVESIVDDYPAAGGDFASSPIVVDLLIPKDKTSCWNVENETKRSKRSEFCLKYGGYGTLCSCTSPLDLNFNTSDLEGNFIRNVPILIIANNRPQLLFKCLLNILRQPGGHKSNIIVVIDGDYEEVNELLHLLEIRYIINPRNDGTAQFKRGAKIGSHYRFSMNKTLNIFPESDFVIIVEDDILVSPDFMSFFNQTAPVLLSDPSLYCINGWNELSAMHTGGSPHRVMREETLPAYGWMTTTQFIKDLTWLTEDKDYDWDVWFKGPQNRGTRECLVPEISRSFHAGESGMHIKGQMTYSHFTGHLSTAHPDIHLQNAERLAQTEYEEDLFTLLESDQIIFLNTSLHPCQPKYIPHESSNKTIVIFISMISFEERYAWGRLSACLGVFDLDTRNIHQGMIKFYFYNTRVLAIGYPVSDYSYLKPSFIRPLSPDGSKWDTSDRGLQYMALMNRRRFRVPHIEKRLPHELLLEPIRPMPLVTTVYRNDTQIKNDTKTN